MDSRVSVIMPSFRAARFIERSMRSVLAQTHRDLELVVIDNPSADGTTEIVSRIAADDPRVLHLRPAANLGGAARTRNHGIEHATGRFLAFLDADDLWRPEKLELQLDLLRLRDGAFSYTGYRVIDEAGQTIVEAEPVPGELAYRDLLKRTAIATSTVLLDRERIGPFRFPEAVPITEDYPAWVGALRVCRTAFGLPAPLADYRIVAHSLSSRKLKSAGVVWRTYRQQEGLGLASAAWCFAHYFTYALAKNRRFGRL